jgi:DNA-binding SARP family transcriptional activator
MLADGTAQALAPRDAALLVWLAIEGATPRERLAALLWPESDADAARNALRQRLFHLRRLVGRDLVSGSKTLSMAADVAHDLVDSDTVLHHMPPTIGGEFDAWLQAQRALRRERQRHALVQQAEQAEQAKDYGEALVYAQTVLALEPLSEESHRRVIRLQYLRGDRAAALLAFDHCERLLKDEVGARPSAQTLALLATVDESNSGPAHAVPLSAVPASVLRPPRLIGRDAVWQTLHAAWDGRHRILVTGEGGMGKSRLIGDFARTRGCIIVASARPGDELVVYASFSRLLRALRADVLRGLDAALRQELARLLPELGTASPLRDADDRARFFHAVAAVLGSEELALDCVVFDDLHFADDASIELLRFVLADAKWNCLIAAREGEISAAGHKLLDDLNAQSSLASVALLPLTLEQVVELVDSLGIAALRGDTAAPSLLRHTGGNPLYLLETVKAWLTRADMPSQSQLPARLPVAGNLHALIERRIGRLSAPAVALARCAAVAGTDFCAELASSVLGVRTLELADPWAELEAAQVFREGAFAHDLIYESALASVPVPVAQQLHAEIAAFLQARESEPARLAQHWEQARHWASAAQAYRLAAQRSRDASRLMEECDLLAQAARCFGLALQPNERFDALLQRARTLASNDLGSDASAAVDELEQAAGTDEQQLLALGPRLELTMTRYEIDAVLILGQRALEQARALCRRDLELRFAIILAGALCDARQAAEAVVVLEPFASWVPTQPDVEQRWEYWEAMALALDYANRLREALPAWEQALAVAQQAARRDMVWKTMSNAASTQAKMGLVEQAAQAGARARQLALASTEGVSMRMLQMQVTLAHRLRDVGRYAEALDLLEEAMRGYELGGGSHSDKALTEQRLVVLFQQLGQSARALPLLAQDRPGLPRGVAMVRLAHRGEIEQRLGRDGLPWMREALQIIPNADDIYHRITSLFATALVPPDEGEVMAASLAVWASARERYGVALSGHVRAAACGLAQGAPSRAAPHAEAALHLAKNYLPDSFYLPEMWLVATQVATALGQQAQAKQALKQGMKWVRGAHESHVPTEFRDSFLHRNPVNAELLALAAPLGV